MPPRISRNEEQRLLKCRYWLINTPLLRYDGETEIVVHGRTTCSLRHVGRWSEPTPYCAGWIAFVDTAVPTTLGLFGAGGQPVVEGRCGDAGRVVGQQNVAGHRLVEDA
jgi:hypothetical protein